MAKVDIGARLDGGSGDDRAAATAAHGVTVAATGRGRP
jgi:hypothetical protein